MVTYNISVPNITDVTGLTIYVNSITGGIFGVGLLFAIALVILFSLFDTFKEKALLASGAITTVMAIFFSWMNWIAPIWIAAYIGIFFVGVMATYLLKHGSN